jgi:hypothetical protein
MPKLKYAQLGDGEWLRTEYLEKNRSSSAIAKEIGCDKGTVCRALKRIGVLTRVRTSRYPQLNDYDWLKEKYIIEGLSLNEIARQVGSTNGNVWTHLKQQNIPIRTDSEGLAKKYPTRRLGELASNWRGGRRTIQHGYIYVYKPDHPNATKSGAVMEHRLIAEKKLGRYLTKDEVVHHIDEDKTNNDPDNLMVMSRYHHKTLHGVIDILNSNEEEVKQLLRNLLT